MYLFGSLQNKSHAVYKSQNYRGRFGRKYQNASTYSLRHYRRQMLLAIAKTLFIYISAKKML